MATEKRHNTVVTTGATWMMGYFSIHLNFPLKRLKEINERFYLIITLEKIDPDKSILISDYTELPESDWMRTSTANLIYDQIPFRLPLKAQIDRDDKGYAVLEILCWAFHPKFTGNRYATLIYDTAGKRDVGISIFQNIRMYKLNTWNAQVLDTEKKLAKQENRAARTILCASAWQPELKFDTVADIHLWRLPEVLPMVDSHLHIQSNHCAPLPLVWDKLPVSNVFEFLRVGWDPEVPDKTVLTKGIIVGAVGALIAGPIGSVFALGGMIANEIRLGKFKPGLDQVSGLLFGESGKIGSGRTDKIGNTLSEILKESKTWSLPFFSTNGPKALATPLPMDMHYGHFHGYHGEPIYKMEKGVFTFRTSPFLEKRNAISRKDTKAYEPYDKQINRTILAASTKSSQWSLLPLYHYDPRRWMEKAEQSEVWDSPFNFVNTINKTANKKTPFIGFKTYTSLGYMPLDPALPHQQHFYERCAAEEIPIMNHCTTAGMYTHDKPFYYDLWKHDPKLKHLHTLDPEIENLESELKNHILKLPTNVLDFSWKTQEKLLLLKKNSWFDKHYVFPSAWEAVAQRWPKLKVCLAHFCGYDFFGARGIENGGRDEDTNLIYGFPETASDELPNIEKTNPLIHGLCKLVRPENQFHFDVSFFFITDYNREAIRNFYHWARAYKGGFILDRMLWGSDWPLLATDSQKGKFLKEAQLKGYVDMNAKEWMSLDPELWFRMAIVNPIRFYNLKSLRPHLETVLEIKAPEAFQNPATTMAEIYERRNKVVG